MITINKDSAEEYESSDDKLNPTVCMVDKDDAGPANEGRGSNEPPASVKQKDKGPASLTNEADINGSTHGFNNAILVSPHESQANQANPPVTDPMAMYNQMHAEIQNL